MSSNLDRYRAEIADLIERGVVLTIMLRRDCSPEFATLLQRTLGDDKASAKDLPTFGTAYQAWYSEAKAVIRQVMPDRLVDFVGHYEPPKGRKELSAHSYRVASLGTL